MHRSAFSVDKKNTFRHIIKELDDKILIQKHDSSEFSVLQQSSGFFTLYSYDDELILAIESFSPESIADSLEDLLTLVTYLKDNKPVSKKLFVTVVGNGGGWVSLGHLLAFAMFPNEYPIYGRYNLRKSVV